MIPPKETRCAEGRGRPEGKARAVARGRTQSRVALPSNLARVSEAAWRDKSTRFTALLHSFSSSPWTCGAPQRKFSPAICAIRWQTSMESLGRPPRQRPRVRYRQSTNQLFQRQRKTVSGWTVMRLSRQPGHQRDNKIQSSSRSRTTEARATTSTALHHRSLMAQCDHLQPQRDAGSEFTSGDGGMLLFSTSLSRQVISGRSKPPMNPRGSSFEKGQ
jgi:hypothetical protein